MITHGHSWLSIQQYTLSEIGIFFRVIIESEREEKAETLLNRWMGNNLEYAGLQEVLNEIDPDRKNRQKEPTIDETRKEWNRLASFMSGKK